MLGAVMFGHRAFQPVIDAIIELAEHCAKEPLAAHRAVGGVQDRWPPSSSPTCGPSWPRPMPRPQKQARQTKISAVKTEAKALFEGNDEALAAVKASGFGNLEADIVRNAILDTGKRIDGRDTKTVRPIVAEVGVLPRAHGSRAVHPRRDPGAGASPRSAPARTSRSSTRSRASTASTSCCTTTSRPTRWARRGRMGSPGRREIGHGKLAWRALRPMLPARTSSPTPSASSRRSPRATARPRWRPSAAARWR